MKVLALNSSPRGGGQSKTELLLSHLVDGMRDAGADVEVVELRHKKISNCIGCFACWTKTPGVCIQKDDMTRELFPKWLEADLAVYGSPLYHFSVNAAMKTFIERTLPVLQPFFEDSGRRTVHPLRAKHPGIVMLSVAGFPDDSVFEQLSAWSRFVFSKGLVGEIYRPAAEVLRLPAFADKTRQILDAVTQAGRELATNRKVSPETLASIGQPLFEDNRQFFEIGNLMWKTCIAEGVTPKEMADKGIVPRPDSIETFMLVMQQGFNSAAAAGTTAILQFDFSGTIQGSCHFKIADGRLETAPGPAEKPTVTIKTPFDIWMDITTSKADGQEMFMQQKYQVTGDLSLLMRMSQIFG